MRRRDFLRATAGGPLLPALPPALLAQTAPRSSADGNWDSGRVRHLLPTVSDTQMLIKASFVEPLSRAPTLRVGTASVLGRMTDTRGENLTAIHRTLANSASQCAGASSATTRSKHAATPS
jgi:hypothetical protein